MSRGPCQCTATWWRFLPLIRQHRVACGSKRAPGDCCLPTEVVPEKDFHRPVSRAEVANVRGGERESRRQTAELDQASLLNSPYCNTWKWQSFQACLVLVVQHLLFVPALPVSLCQALCVCQWWCASLIHLQGERHFKCKLCA